MTQQKSKLIFAVQDISRPLLTKRNGDLLLRWFGPKRRKMFIINVAELFLFSQTTGVS